MKVIPELMVTEGNDSASEQDDDDDDVVDQFILHADGLTARRLSAF